MGVSPVTAAAATRHWVCSVVLSYQLTLIVIIINVSSSSSSSSSSSRSTVNWLLTLAWMTRWHPGPLTSSFSPVPPAPWRQTPLIHCRSCHAGNQSPTSPSDGAERFCTVLLLPATVSLWRTLYLNYLDSCLVAASGTYRPQTISFYLGVLCCRLRVSPAIFKTCWSHFFLQFLSTCFLIFLFFCGFVVSTVVLFGVHVCLNQFHFFLVTGSLLALWSVVSQHCDVTNVRWTEEDVW